MIPVRPYNKDVVAIRGDEGGGYHPRHMPTVGSHGIAQMLRKTTTIMSTRPIAISRPDVTSLCSRVPFLRLFILPPLSVWRCKQEIAR